MSTSEILEPTTQHSSRRTLARYVPRIAINWDDDAAGRSWQELDATLCFVDISGFTNLSERLARSGRIGAEELTAVLNRVFGAMLEIAYSDTGSLLKFGGDALLLMFRGDDHAVRAASAAIEMRRALRKIAMEKTSAGRLRLRMSVGIHSGIVHLFKAGATHHELVITGPAGTSTTEMEHVAKPGEIVISEATRARLPGTPTVEKRGEGWLLNWRSPRRKPEGGRREVSDQAELAEPWVPVALRDFLLATDPEPEHRTATVGFIRFCETDSYLAKHGPEALAAQVDATISAIQRAAAVEDVTFLATDINEDGGKAILVAGSPTSHEDDEGRMLRTLRRIAERKTPLHLHIGVNRGHVFSGEVGTPYRMTFTVIGDTVNVAARLAAAAPAGAIYATPDVLDRSRTLFDVQTLEPFHVKGKTEPVQAYLVEKEVGDRSQVTRDELPFVAREAELESLSRSIAAWQEGEGSVVDVVGATGTGKSRLVSEALAEASSAPTLTLRAEPYGAAQPYRPFRDPVRQLLGIERGSGAAMARRLRAAVAACDESLVPFAPLIGDLAHIDVPPTEESAAIEPRFRRNRLADVFVQLLDRLAEGSVLLLADDSHWMDEASTHLLERLCEATGERPWLLIATRRDVAGGFTPSAAQRIDVGPLAADEARDLVIAATAAAPLRPHDVDVIVRRSGGNPFFLGEIMQIVRETGSTDALPDSLDSVVSTKIDGLDPLPRRVLRYCSVLGRSFRNVVIDEILAEEEGLELDDATTSALSEFLVEDGDDRLRFRDAMVRDVAYEGLSFTRRKGLHIRAAEVIEETTGEDKENVAGVLAMHYSLGHDYGRAWEYGRIAGDRARETYSNEDAAVQYERALEAAHQLEACPDRDLVAVWTNLGDVRELAGRFDDAFEAYRAASRLAKDDPIVRAELHLKRARARERSGASAIALREVTTGRKLVKDLGTADAAAADANLLSFGAVIRQAQDRPREALKMAQQAAEAATDVDARWALAHAYSVMDWAYVMIGQPERAVHREKALAIYAELGELAMQAVELSNLGADAYWIGEWDKTLDLYDRAADAALRAGNSALAALVHSNAGEVQINQGHFDRAVPILRNAERVLRASRRLDDAAFAEIQLARALCAQGSYEEAAQLLELAKRHAKDVGRSSMLLEAALVEADMSIWLGEPGRALDTLANARSAASSEMANFYQASLSRVQATALAQQGDLAAARTVASAAIADLSSTELSYDTALLALTLAALDDVTNQDTGRADSAEAVRLLERLGVDAVPVPLPPGAHFTSRNSDLFARRSAG